MLSDEPFGSYEVAAIVSAVGKFLVDDSSLGGGVDEDTRTVGVDFGDHCYVPDASLTACAAAEEEQVARTEVAFRHFGAACVLHTRGAREAYAFVAKHVADESGAVEALGSGSTPYVAGAEIFAGIVAQATGGSIRFGERELGDVDFRYAVGGRHGDEQGRRDDVGCLPV